MKNLLRNSALLLLLAAVGFIFSCKDDEEPAVDVIADFDFAIDATDPAIVQFTNKSTGFASLAWAFGDGGTSTEANPSHTYTTEGDFTVVLTATDSKGKAVTQSKVVSISLPLGPFDESKLVGGAWKVKNGDKTTVFVGPGLGSPDWWQVPGTHFNGSAAGTADDWSCMLDDEWIFTASGTAGTGSMEYKTNGVARNDGYMGGTQGCWTDAEIAASGNGAAFGSGTHSYELIPDTASPSGRWIIKLTNGASGAAFIGFYKGFYGGENSSAGNPPNGGNATTQYEVMKYEKVAGKEELTVSVDISAAHDGSAAWTAVLTR